MIYYKLYKVLLENEDYSQVSMLAKVAYGIYVDMLENRINVKKDENGIMYLTDVRKALEEELGLSSTTITKIHKELSEADLIEEKWAGLNLPYMTYIKYYETFDFEQTKESEEMKEIGEVLNTKNSEFSDFDIKDGKEVIAECVGEFPYIEVSRIIKNIDQGMYSERDLIMIKLSLAWLHIYYSTESDDYEEIIEYIDEEVLDEVLSKNRRTHPVDSKIIIIGKEIFRLAKANYENYNN